jgi:hypothetical protein
MTQNEKQHWFKRLQERWQVNAFQAVIILIVFACTGTTVLFIKEPLLNMIIGEEEKNWLHSLLYFILILPIYNILLLIYGFIFGQFKFFWNFEKRFFKRMFGKKNVA